MRETRIEGVRVLEFRDIAGMYGLRAAIGKLVFDNYTFVEIDDVVQVRRNMSRIREGAFAKVLPYDFRDDPLSAPEKYQEELRQLFPDLSESQIAEGAQAFARGRAQHRVDTIFAQVESGQL